MYVIVKPPLPRIEHNFITKTNIFNILISYCIPKFNDILLQNSVCSKGCDRVPKKKCFSMRFWSLRTHNYTLQCCRVNPTPVLFLQRLQR